MAARTVSSGGVTIAGDVLRRDLGDVSPPVEAMSPCSSGRCVEGAR